MDMTAIPPLHSFYNCLYQCFKSDSELSEYRNTSYRISILDAYYFYLGAEGEVLIRGGRLFERGAYLKSQILREGVMKNAGFVPFVNYNLEYRLQN